MARAEPILAIQALAEPPPGVDVREPIDSMNSRTLELTNGPSVSADLMQYLQGGREGGREGHAVHVL